MSQQYLHLFFFSSRRRHTRFDCDWSSDVCSSDLNDIPLLFEVLDPGQFDLVVLVDAAVPLRRTRLRAMRGLSNEEADRMIAAQMPAERKRPRSQFVIDNDEIGRASCRERV